MCINMHMYIHMVGLPPSSVNSYDIYIYICNQDELGIFLQTEPFPAWFKGNQEEHHFLPPTQPFLTCVQPKSPISSGMRTKPVPTRVVPRFAGGSAFTACSWSCKRSGCITSSASKRHRNSPRLCPKRACTSRGERVGSG